MVNATVQYFPTFSESDIGNYCGIWQKKYPNLAIFAMVSESKSSKVPALQQYLSKLNISLMGAIFPALIDNAEFKTNGLLLFCFPSKPQYFLLPDIIGEDTNSLHDSVKEITNVLSSHIDETEKSSLFMIFDAMLPCIATILDNFYAELGNSIHYMGVNAGSESFQPMPCLFDNDQIIQNGMLIILMSSNSRSLLSHGYQPPEKMHLATSTIGNLIETIDWKPAFEVYSQLIKEQYNVEINSVNFYEHAVHFPFGIIRADNEILVRIPVMLDDNSLFCVGEIPENSILTLLEAPKADSLKSVAQLNEQLNGNPIDLLFYCAGRRMHLFDAASVELKTFQESMGEQNIVGALSLGEIGSSHNNGYPLFHNAALLALQLT